MELPCVGLLFAVRWHLLFSLPCPGGATAIFYVNGYIYDMVIGLVYILIP